MITRSLGSNFVHISTKRWRPSCKADRTAILLRFYEKKTLREVGQQLGITEDAAKKRVTRAVEKMRGSLTRRGVVLGGAGLVVLLAEQIVQAAPTNLAIGIVKAATTSLSASAALPRLARETLHAWRLVKLKLVVGIAAIYRWQEHSWP